jgi:hypothetical protein
MTVRPLLPLVYVTLTPLYPVRLFRCGLERNGARFRRGFAAVFFFIFHLVGFILFLFFRESIPAIQVR